MKRNPAILFTTALLCVALAGYGYYELVHRRPVAVNDPWGLWIAALKGFEGTVRYVGDDSGYSYFTTGSDVTPRYMRPTEKTALPRHFPLGKELPYRVTQEMLPRYIPPASSRSIDPQTRTDK